MITAFRRVRTQNDDVQQLQDAVGVVLQDLRGRTLIDGRLVEGVVLAAAQINVVDHLLNRPVRGYIVVRASASANVWDTQDKNVTPSRSLHLWTSAAVTVTLWVF